MFSSSFVILNIVHAVKKKLGGQSVLTLIQRMSESGRVMRMRTRLTPVSMREQGPGPVGSAGQREMFSLRWK